MKKESAIKQIKETLGPQGWSNDPDIMAPLLTDSEGGPQGNALILACPANTEEVSTVLQLCHQANIPVVPQGGNTGCCGGAIPNQTGTEVLLSLRRMNRIRDLDSTDYTLTAEAGCILHDLKHAAEEANRFFPLSLGAEGSCQIGGNLATNAGGINVLNYGNTRDLVLGLEVVLPDGTLWNGLRRLRKDNSGYDLKHLFIGSEGTLGIITAVTLKLFPLPHTSVTSCCALSNLESGLSLLAIAREYSGDQVNSFELLPRIAMEMIAKHRNDLRLPFPSDEAQWYVLMELNSSRKNDDLAALTETILEEAFTKNMITNAIIAQSEQQRNQLWSIREAAVEVQKSEGYSVSHDVAVPVSKVAELIKLTCERASELLPGIRPYPFGHVGDGNIHFNFFKPDDMTDIDFKGLTSKIHTLVYETVNELNGSISAEHGIGRAKTDELEIYRSAIEISLMKAVKETIDPSYLMNPGKVINQKT
ncbi:FAD-binding oxidoreductase [Amphritea opalescens]|uniref:FAD-binding oxidoreductase n=1 Tax=Amphritea opalescens TaxID=2490544 RepID=A0A430KVF3_9GAMM|nr:FAD-binding oxidoreductase [Amphritea opalescens]RTE67323.1 FAD-binding oxidoreductase [Amphritea opalescens]